MNAPAPRPPSLRRELAAILFLYAAIAILPLLVGWGCGP
jgi:hypothetical protein